MRCLLVFDNLNDIIYAKYNQKFYKHIWALATSQGLVSEGNKDESRDMDIILQLFSPLVTSQRIMINHFSNAYSSIKCYDGLSIIFDEYMGYVFTCIGYDRDYWLKRQLGVFIACVKRICGPDVSLLKTSEKKRQLIGALISDWSHSVLNEQSVLVEAVEQVRLSSQVTSKCSKTLTEAVEKTKSVLSCSQIHALILVNHRFVSLYSTRAAAELHTSDLLFLSFIGKIVELGVFEKDYNGTSEMADDSSDSEDETEASQECFYSPEESRASNSPSVKSCNPTASEVGGDFSFNTICLLGKQRPNAIHVSYIARNIPVFIVYESGNEFLNSSILEATQALYALQNLQIRGTTDREVLHSSVDVVDNTIKKMTEVFKKKSSSSLSKIHSNTMKKITKNWEPIRKKYIDYMKSHNVEVLQTVDSALESLMSLMRSTYSSCMMDDSTVSVNHDVVLPILCNVRKALQDFTEMIQTKVHRNFNLATKSTLSINKYLEEFPGLVHFLYIDRITHRFVAPSLDFNSPETTNLTKKKIWSMFEFARSHLQEGHLYLIWKDTVFSYSYFLWFEDMSGTPLKPKISPQTVIKSLPVPGVFTGDFYHQLIKKCFPAQSSQRVRCFELFALHLGLVTASSVLEQSRRLTATIWEVTGVSANSSDL